MTEAERWYAAKRVQGRPHRVERLRGQPEDGFRDLGQVTAWLQERGLVGPWVRHDDGASATGWGDPYCAVAAWRDDPWEEGGDG